MSRVKTAITVQVCNPTVLWFYTCFLQVTASVAQRRLQQELEDQSREELISYYKALQLDLEARLDNVVIEHSSCHLMKRKV